MVVMILGALMKLLALLGILIAVSARADYKDFYFQRAKSKSIDYQWSQEIQLRLETHEFEQRVNHSDTKDSRTFKQRYFINTQFAESSLSPTLFYLCGESVCEGFSGVMATYAKELKANLVAIEHRYYGKSHPFSQLTTENLKYLTTEFALIDAASLQKHLMDSLGFKGKWIVFGGSYAGSLAAYYRQKFPDLTVGALASSGPVKAKANFEEYDRHVAKVAGPDCLKNIKRVVKQVEDSLSNPVDLNLLKKKFSAEALLTELDFMYLIADMAALAVQYGYRDHFCELIASENPIDGYASFTQEIFQSWGLTALSGSASGAISLNPADYEKDFGMRQWLYQSCTEYGYWQNAYHDESQSARSKWINQKYHDDVCRRLFGIEKPSNTELTNRTFFLPLLSPTTTHIFFTNGAQDPWINLSIAKENGNLTNPNISGVTIDGAAHCDDLRTPKDEDSSSLKSARAQFIEFAKSWLKN
ncbi:alpha/beta fold hydrolase [bacterium]|nr:alpha/beta fold hydrolase [bacterium]